MTGLHVIHDLIEFQLFKLNEKAGFVYTKLSLVYQYFRDILWK